MTEVSKEAVEALIRAVQNVDETIELDLIDATAIAFELQSQGFTIAPIAPVTDEKLREAVEHVRGCLWPSGKESFDEIVSALSELAQRRAETKLMATRYEVGNELTIERASHRPDTWAIRKYGYCMAKDGKFEYEPMPSNRDAAFLERCRFNSLSAAVAALPASQKEE